MHSLRIAEVARELGAHWHRGALDRVIPERHLIVTANRTQISYDRVIVALGARCEREWQSAGVLTYHGRRDGPAYRLLLRQIQDGRVTKVAFVRPTGASWLSPYTTSR